MAESKIQSTDGDVSEFLSNVEDDRKREDSLSIPEMMSVATGEKPQMWGSNIVGFGKVHLRYDSGRELDWFKVGFSSRKANISASIYPRSSTAATGSSPTSASTPLAKRVST